MDWLREDWLDIRTDGSEWQIVLGPHLIASAGLAVGFALGWLAAVLF
jgi:hypothetical protein